MNIYETNILCAKFSEILFYYIWFSLSAFKINRKLYALHLNFFFLYQMKYEDGSVRYYKTKCIAL